MSQKVTSQVVIFSAGEVQSHGKTWGLSGVGIKDAERMGSMLTGANLIPELIFIPPEDVFEETVGHAVKNMGKEIMPDQVNFDDCLGKILEGDGGVSSRKFFEIQFKAKTNNCSVADLIELVDDGDELRAKCEEAASSILKVIKSHPGKTIWVGSHSIFRIEPMLAFLLKKDLTKIPNFSDCSFAVLEFEGDAIGSVEIHHV